MNCRTRKNGREAPIKTPVNPTPTKGAKAPQDFDGRSNLGPSGQEAPNTRDLKTKIVKGIYQV